jgi:hypothetical protein
MTKERLNEIIDKITKEILKDKRHANTIWFETLIRITIKKI